ncbi:MAG: cytochrome c [Marinovum algicola]|jgi:mono/diheme cytochrome c family protein|uniref:Cytochrome c, mono-and diheme variants n=1 Tax=Marinovum algicola TaxID=42444 RepID=A0A975WB56_9RHOB|nr:MULTISPECIES: cytochrome c [Marinovum]MDD9743987.1 cytochrome c [Marinovum sp. PR37]SEJ71065.1 Cytochrome c, mono-and diheme variants [Marinovum algicola]SLN55382.1 Nicotinate dehydrogenase subunit B [Marinovum algicola]
MRQFLIAGIAGLSLAGATTVAALVAWPIGSDPRKIEPEGDVQRGAYLARASGCVACHTNFEEGGAALAGGAPLNTDFGTFYPPNLTTDPDHGLGNWDVEQFAKAIRQGIAPDGTPYYPAFTYPFYANFSDQDIADLWAAFQTVAPVAESTPEHDVGFPFDQRWGLKLWRAAFFGAPETAPVDGKSAEWNRGRELVRGAAHCAACHTGRNLAGGRDPSAFFAGNDALPGGNKAPSILPATLAERGWTVDNLSYALQSGITPSGDVFGGSMGEVVQNGTRFLTQADLRAMATYLMEGEGLKESAVAALSTPQKTYD